MRFKTISTNIEVISQGFSKYKGRLMIKRAINQVKKSKKSAIDLYIYCRFFLQIEKIVSEMV
jgi:hypothetical protein